MEGWSRVAARTTAGGSNGGLLACDRGHGGTHDGECAPERPVGLAREPTLVAGGALQYIPSCVKSVFWQAGAMREKRPLPAMCTTAQLKWTCPPTMVELAWF
jgi:hypothetical protein